MGIRHRHSSSSAASAQRVLDPASQVKIAYVEPADLSRWLATSGTFPLGVVSFGSPLPMTLQCPVVQLDCPILEGPSRCEVWSSDHPVRLYKDSGLSAAISGDLLFGSIMAFEDPGTGLNHTTERAYQQLLRLLRESGFPTPVANMELTFLHINEEQHGLERYRLFCMGRHEALADMPARFSGLIAGRYSRGNTRRTASNLFSCGRPSATHLGSPRQINAYEYPKIYGPRSPSFARATLCQSDSTTQLFISGTASVVGHQSQHEGLADAQALETVTNLRALIDMLNSRRLLSSAKPRLQSVFQGLPPKPKHLETVRRVLDAPFLLTSRLLYLQGDLCRKELLVEIEGLVTAD